MKKHKQRRIFRGAEGWRGIVERYERREVSAEEFCRRERIASSSLWKWRKALGGKARAVVPASFVEVSPGIRAPSGNAVELRFPNGMVLRVVGE